MGGQVHRSGRPRRLHPNGSATRRVVGRRTTGARDPRAGPDARRGRDGRPDRCRAGGPDRGRRRRDGAGRPAACRRRGLRDLHQRAEEASRAIAEEERVEVEWSPLFRISPIQFDTDMVAAGSAIITDLQGVDARLPSGPLHDAARVAEAGVPTVMLFVRSKRGLSHTREEDTDEADLELALSALERLVAGELARRG
ncbi:MAG TPA: M20/M25/M40 family metallo-hydrolase [Polyangia bacterium]|nr:M20/M25/M40 family metallo-hydrolase [Polyangia bacterium]